MPEHLQHAPRLRVREDVVVAVAAETVIKVSWFRSFLQHRTFLLLLHLQQQHRYKQRWILPTLR